MTKPARFSIPWLGVAAAVAALLIALTAPWREVELRIFDAMETATAPNKAELPITIVGIDEESFAHLRQQWPWPRRLHARLLDNLREAGVTVVAFDVVFAEPTARDEDSAFAAAIRRHGAVVLASDIAYAETAGTRQWLRVDPLTEFTRAGALAGLAAVQLDPDGTQRQLPANGDSFWSRIAGLLEQRAPGTVARLQATPAMRIRYQGGPHTFTYIPYYQLLEPDKYLPAGWREFLKDNVVIVGRDLKATTEVGSAQSDMFQTPFFAAGHELMPGAEVQANALTTMVQGTPVTEAPRAWSVLFLLLTAAAALVLMRRWTPLRSSLAALLLAGAIAGLAWVLFVQPLIWLPAGGAILVTILVYVAQGGAAYFAEQQQRRQIKDAFQKYVAPTVVDQMIAHPEKLRLGGERRELTLMFTDLAGFTSISEAMAPEEIGQLLNRHLSEMTEVILRHNGTVDKFIGDAVMAFWGAPLPDEEQSMHALQAAIDMQAKVAVMREEVLAAGGPRLHMRVGIHRGECVVGNFGGDNRFDYTAIGDSVNLTSRLEGVNKVYGTEILVSDAVAEAVAGRIPLRRVDTVRVKGKQNGITIHTPCADPELARLTEAALAAYGGARWHECVRHWEAVWRQAPEDPVGAVWRERLEEMADYGVPPDWDGITTLESK